MKRFRVSLFAAIALIGISSMVGSAVAGDCCEPCAPPPPVNVSWCVVDPCTGCKYEVTACLPACCKCETPCLVDWNKGLLGRKILTYKFECGECVDVVITKHGKTIVRD